MGTSVLFLHFNRNSAQKGDVHKKGTGLIYCVFEKRLSSGGTFSVRFKVWGFALRPHKQGLEVQNFRTEGKKTLNFQFCTYFIGILELLIFAERRNRHMDTCTFMDFMQVLKPWLNDDYIRRAHYNDEGYFTLMFVDGGEKVYQVDDCTAAQLNDAIALLKKNGVPVFK
jgi:hypothetical protein